MRRFFLSCLAFLMLQGCISNNPYREEETHKNYSHYTLPGTKVIDRYTYQITLKQKYPQFAYWLAMPFFAPMAKEAELFFSQPSLVDLNLTLDNRPVGKGAYRLEKFLPNKEIVIVKNENVHPEFYPTEGEPQDRELGLLKDAGRPPPFVDKLISTIVFRSKSTSKTASCEWLKMWRNRASLFRPEACISS